MGGVSIWHWIVVGIVVMLLFAKHTRQPVALARPFVRGLK